MSQPVSELTLLCDRLHDALGEYAEPGEHYADAAARLIRERDQLEEHVTSLQRRGTELLDEARANRRIANAPPGELVALSYFSHERRLQDDRFGTPAALLHVPDGTGAYYKYELAIARANAAAHCKETGRETCCWTHVILEEAFEAVVEADPKRLRQELVQLGAVCARVIEAIDIRANVNPLPATGGIPLRGWHCTATRLVTDGERTRQECCRTFNGANPKWLERCRSCDSPGPAEDPQ